MLSNIKSKIVYVFTNPYFHTVTLRVKVTKKPDRYIDFYKRIPDELYKVRCYA